MNPASVKSSRSLEDRLSDLHDMLRVRRNEILKGIEDHSKKGASIREMKELIFAMMCDALYKAAREFHFQGDKARRERNFYLWPGYESLIPGTNGSTRIDLRVSLDSLVAREKPKEVECGVSPVYWLNPLDTNLREERRKLLSRRVNSPSTSFNHSLLRSLNPDTFEWGIEKERLVQAGLGLCNVRETHDDNCPFRIMGNPASVGFWAFLTRIEEASAFPLGSTHQWIADQHGEVNPTTGLLFTTRRKNTKGLSPNSSDMLVCRIKSPSVHSPIWEATPTDWPKIVEPKDVSVKDMTIIRNLARDRYWTWFQTVFLPARRKKMGITLPDSMNGEDLASRSFLKRLDLIVSWWKSFQTDYPLLSDFIRKRSTYSHWYSLGLDASTSSAVQPETESKSLGSMMIFTDFPLDVSFLRTVRVWTENVYLLLREAERSTQSREIGKYQGAAETLWAQSHELSSELSNIQRSRLMRPKGWEEVEQWKLNFPNEVPFMIAFPPKIIDAQLEYLSYWLERWAGIPQDQQGNPHLDSFLYSLFTKAKRMASVLEFSSYPIAPKKLALTESRINENAEWLDANVSFSCVKGAKLVDSVLQGPTNRAATTLARIFYTAFFNFAKHWSNVERAKRANLKAWINIEIQQAELIVISLHNEFDTQKTYQNLDPNKENGTAMTLLTLGAPFGLNKDALFFDRDLNHNGIWVTRIPLLATYRNPSGKELPWLKIG